MKIYVKKVEGLRLPERATPRSTGWDIFAASEPKIVGNPVGDKWKSIDYIEYETNLYIQPETLTHDVKIFARSSVSKKNYCLANGVGVIDNDYRNSIKFRFDYLWQPEDLVFENGQMLGKVNIDKIYDNGEAIGQMVITQVIPIEFELVDELTNTERGTGGFGSTDQPSKFNPARLTELQQKQQSSPGKTLIEVFAESDHNIETPDKDSYLKAIKERENQI